MNKKILITGSSGMMGHAVLDVFSTKYPEWDLFPVSRSDFDITDSKQSYNFIKQTGCSHILNLSAYTKVDDCESEREIAISVNSDGVRNLAEICKKLELMMIHISTDYVFNGEKKTAYVEDDEPAPINFHGRSKLAGEDAIQKNLKNYLIVRTSWLYGPNGPNFVKSIINASKKKSILKVVNDQTGSPTFTKDLAMGITDLINLDAKGIFHLTNSEFCTWFDFAKKILELCSINDVDVIPVTTAEYNLPANRPNFSVLNCEKFKQLSGKKMRNWEAALEDYVQTKYIR